jgi:hypothetical protein
MSSRANYLNGNPDFPKKSYKVGKYTVTNRDGQWLALDSEGVIQKSHRDESFITSWANKS